MNYNEALKGRGSKLNRIVVDARSDADDKDGRWVTTESGKHMFINSEGEPTKGNPHVLAAAKGESKPSSGGSASNNAGGNGGEKNGSKKSEAPAKEYTMADYRKHPWGEDTDADHKLVIDMLKHGKSEVKREIIDNDIDLFAEYGDDMDKDMRDSILDAHRQAGTLKQFQREYKRMFDEDLDVGPEKPSGKENSSGAKIAEAFKTGGRIAKIQKELGISDDDMESFIIENGGDPDKAIRALETAKKISSAPSAPKGEAKKSTPNRYSEVAESMKKKAAANPYNLYYQDQAHNYELLSKAADEFDSSAKEHAGMHTVVALERAKIGDVVEIEGSLFDGKYKLQNVKSPLSGRSGPAWVAQDEKNHKHSFGNDASTIMSELRLIRGGKANDDKTKKVSFVS